MRKLLFIIVLLLVGERIFAQSEPETLKKANGLIADKKYESAFELLDKFDKDNSKSDIVLLKEDIVLNYFVTSVMHQVFSLMDIKKNEDINDFRGKEGSSSAHIFEADSILTQLIKKYPDNYKLYKGLGDYYYAAQTHYSGNWLKNDSILFELILKNYRVAVDHNLGDYSTYFALGLANLSLSRFKGAIPDLLKATELKKDYVDAEYNLAYAYLFIDDRENCIKYAKHTIDLYKEPNLKSDAARMVAQCYVELKDDINAVKYYELANSINPENYDNLKALLGIYVRTDNAKRKKVIGSFYDLAPEKPTIYNDLSHIYSDSTKELELRDFLESKLASHPKEKKIEGSLYFYLGQIYLDFDKKKAKEYFLKSKDIFSTIFEKDNEVFEAIEQGIREAEGK